jgi:pyruvate carboxylase subunit B
MTLDVQPKAVPDHFSLLVNGASLLMAIEQQDEQNRYRIHAGGHDFDADVVSAREAYLREFLRAAGVGARQGRVAAPMPGKIVQVEVSVGDDVEESAGIMVMEAMKMENEIKAPIPGKVIAIHVEAGSAVEKGQLLFEIE